MYRISCPGVQSRRATRRLSSSSRCCIDEYSSTNRVALHTLCAARSAPVEPAAFAFDPSLFWLPVVRDAADAGKAAVAGVVAGVLTVLMS